MHTCICNVYVYTFACTYRTRPKTFAFLDDILVSDLGSIHRFSQLKQRLAINNESQIFARHFARIQHLVLPNFSENQLKTPFTI